MRGLRMYVMSNAYIIQWERDGLYNVSLYNNVWSKLFPHSSLLLRITIIERKADFVSYPFNQCTGGHIQFTNQILLITEYSVEERIPCIVLYIMALEGVNSDGATEAFLKNRRAMYMPNLHWKIVRNYDGDIAF